MSLDVFDASGKNALMYASTEAAVKLLLKLGADPLRQNKYGESALTYAKKYKPEQAHLYAEAAKLDDYYRSVASGDTETMMELQPGMSQQARNSALFIACMTNNISTMKLIESPDVNAMLDSEVIAELKRRYIDVDVDVDVDDARVRPIHAPCPTQMDQFMTKMSRLTVELTDIFTEMDRLSAEMDQVIATINQAKIDQNIQFKGLTAAMDQLDQLKQMDSMLRQAQEHRNACSYYPEMVEKC